MCRAKLRPRPFGLFLATFVTFQVTGVYFNDPLSWRYVFLFSHTRSAFMVRLFVKEPERWRGRSGRTRADRRVISTSIYKANESQFYRHGRRDPTPL